MENKIAHLQMIQGVINRMGSNSFAAKGWSITLTAAIFALASAKDADKTLLWIPYVPVIVFWLLDAFFLRQEHFYRRLYERVRAKDETQIDFSMDARGFAGKVGGLIGIAGSKTLGWFHGSILLIIAVVHSIVGNWWPMLSSWLCALLNHLK